MDIATDSPPPPYPGDPLTQEPASPTSTVPPNTPMPVDDVPLKMQFPPSRAEALNEEQKDGFREPFYPMSAVPPNTPMPIDDIPHKMEFPPSHPEAPKTAPVGSLPTPPLPVAIEVAGAVPAYQPVHPMMQQYQMGMMPAPFMSMPSCQPMMYPPYPQCMQMQPMMPYMQQPMPNAANGGINVVVNTNANANSSAAGGLARKSGFKLGQICPYCKKGVISRIQDSKRKTKIFACAILTCCCLFCLPCSFLCCNYVDACPVCKKVFGHRGCKGNKKKK